MHICQYFGFSVTIYLEGEVDIMIESLPKIVMCPGGNEYYYTTGDTVGSLIIGLIWTITQLFLVGAVYGYFRKVNTLKSVIVLIVITLSTVYPTYTPKVWGVGMCIRFNAPQPREYLYIYLRYIIRG